MATDLLRESTDKVLMSMSVPISIGMLSTFLFQVIDTYFVGQLGANELAALSFASTVYFLLVGLFIGLSVGISTIIGKSAGGGDREKVKRTTILSLLVTLLLSGLFALVGINTVEPLFQMLGANNTILPLIEQYMIPLYIGIPILTMGIVGGGILRASGNVTLPEVAFGVGGVINLIFDYLLIFGKGGFPALGIKGAAYATILSWIFIFLMIMFLLIRDRLFGGNIFQELSKNKVIIQEMFRLGLPTMLTQLIGPATLMYITFLLAKQTTTAVAAFGVAGRIETLLMIGILGVSTAATPFISQNLGAKQHLRIDEAIVFGGKASTYLGVLLCLILFLFIAPIAALFSEDQQVIDYTKEYFYIVSLSYVFYGFYIITSSIFNGLQLPVNSLKIILVKTVAFTIPLTMIGSFFGGVRGIFIGLSISNILGGLFATFEMRKQLNKVGSPLLNRNPLNDYKADIKALGRFVTAYFR